MSYEFQRHPKTGDTSPSRRVGSRVVWVSPRWAAHCAPREPHSPSTLHPTPRAAGRTPLLPPRLSAGEEMGDGRGAADFILLPRRKRWARGGWFATFSAHNIMEWIYEYDCNSSLDTLCNPLHHQRRGLLVRKELFVPTVRLVIVVVGLLPLLNWPFAQSSFMSLHRLADGLIAHCSPPAASAGRARSSSVELRRAAARGRGVAAYRRRLQVVDGRPELEFATAFGGLSGPPAKPAAQPSLATVMDRRGRRGRGRGRGGRRRPPTTERLPGEG